MPPLITNDASGEGFCRTKREGIETYAGINNIEPRTRIVRPDFGKLDGTKPQRLFGKKKTPHNTHFLYQ